MNATAVFLTSLVLLAAQPARPSKPQDVPPRRFDKFVVELIEDVQVPAREPGVLVALDAKKGDFVKKDAVLGRIDDSDAQVRKLVAEAELKSAHEQASSDASVRAADATIGVAQAEYEQSKKIRERSENAVSEFELRRMLLTAERSVYQAETARVELAIAKHTEAKATAQLQAVQNEIGRRLVTSPIDGFIVDKFHEVGEWAQAGEPVYRVIRMDRLRVEGMLTSTDYLPEDVLGQPVRILVTAKGRQEEFEGTIDFASQLVDDAGEFKVHAEFDNPRKPNGQWLVLPGLDAAIELLPSTKAPVSASAGDR